MPAPVTSWVTGTWPTSKSLNLSLYTCDGTDGNPNGIAFAAYRPILFEAYNRTGTLSTSSGGSQSALSTSGSITTAWVLYDTPGYYGQTQDAPGLGYYQFTGTLKGSSGDGVTPGGWTLLSHFAAIKAGGTQTSISADLLGTTQTPVSGTRQAPAATMDSIAYFCDLVNVGDVVTWQPAVTIADSGSVHATTVTNLTDSSGETSRFLAVWAASATTMSGQASYQVGGTYQFTAAASSTVVQAWGSGAGAGAGNSSLAGVEYGGGGGGGGEFAAGTIPTTIGNNYTVTVALGGAGGTAPGGAGAPGAASVVGGDSGSPVTAHGGSSGGGASTGANGAGGAGGTGASGTHHNGGAGATGSTGSYGGGGGSSAGTAHTGTTATSAAGATAPAGGGPGGAGGAQSIGVVQPASRSTQSNTLAVTFGNPVQAGNTVIVCAIFQGTGPPGKPAPNMTCALSDGTAMPSDVFESLQLGTNIQVAVFRSPAASGGETGFTVTGYGVSNLVIIAEAWEVQGLGSSPAVDVSNGKALGGGSPQTGYNIQKTTHQAPEFWVGTVGAQGDDGAFNINPPSPGGTGTWNMLGQNSNSSGGFYSRLIAGYQVATTTGVMQFNGSFGLDRGQSGVSYGAIVIGYTTSAPTPGSAPVLPPGGGGGGGLGSANGGGNGDDGQVILTWNVPGGAYGTPATPAPFTAWTDETTIGTSAGGAAVDVDINSAAGVAGVLNFLSSPPVFRVGAGTAQSIGNATLTNVAFTNIGASVDPYTGWNAGTGTYTIQRNGLYLYHGLAAFAANSAGTRRAGVTITVGGTASTYWGPPTIAASTGTTNVAKTQIFSLQAGDTVQLACRQTAGSSLALATTDQSRFLLMWLGLEGVPSSLWTPPDTTYRWVAGTSDDALAAGFQAHLANDLGFLCNRPYFMGYQGTAQTGLTTGQFSTLTMDTTTGLIHPSDVGDNYSGWTAGAANKYTSQASGWYLTCLEGFTAAASSSPAMVTAGLAVGTSGGHGPSQTPDWYQQLQATTLAATGGGAAALGCYYLAAGESITPQLMASSAGFGGTYSTLTGLQNNGLDYSHFECCWISE